MVRLVDGGVLLEASERPRVLMVGPFPPAVGGLANNMSLLSRSSLADRFTLIPFSTAKRRRHIFPNRPAWDSLPYLLYHTVALAAAIARRRPAAVYLKATSDTGFLRDTALMTVARLFRRPVLCHLHGRPMGRFFADPRGARARFTRWGMRRAQAVVVLSPGLARAFAAHFPGRELVPVPNVVDTARFRPGTERGGAPLRILTVGRLSREKGTWDLLRVAENLARRGFALEFRLCGIGETAREEAELRADASRRGLDGALRFLGTVRGETLLEEYARADAFFLPTYAEIFPNVVLEALAAGLPVVTTNVPVIPEMFEEGVEGYRFAPGDMDGMGDALARLAADGALRARMGSAARALAERRYGVERAAETLGGLLERLIAGRGE